MLAGGGDGSEIIHRIPIYEAKSASPSNVIHMSAEASVLTFLGVHDRDKRVRSIILRDGLQILPRLALREGNI